MLAIRKRVNGPVHLDTLATWDRLARWTGEAGDPGAARDQYAAVLRTRREFKGQFQQATLTTWNNFAHWTRKAGDAAGARDQFAALSRVYNTQAVRDNLAYWTRQASRGPE